MGISYYDVQSASTSENLVFLYFPCSNSRNLYQLCSIHLTIAAVKCKEYSRIVPLLPYNCSITMTGIVYNCTAFTAQFHTNTLTNSLNISCVYCAHKYNTLLYTQGEYSYCLNYLNCIPEPRPPECTQRSSTTSVLQCMQNR